MTDTPTDPADHRPTVTELLAAINTDDDAARALVTRYGPAAVTATMTAADEQGVTVTCHCGAPGTLTYDPYAADIHDDLIPVDLCEPHLQNLRDEI